MAADVYTFAGPVDFLGNEARDFCFQALPARPSSPYFGQVILNTATGVVEVWNGSGWLSIQGGGGNLTSVTLTTPSGMQVSNGSTQTLSAPGTFALSVGVVGMVKGGGGGFAQAVAGTDYVDPAGSYSNPTWLASLAGSKVTGDIAGRASGLTAQLAESGVTGLINDLAARELLANKGIASGYAALDSAGKVPLTQIPAGIVNSLQFQGMWDAAANAPALASGVGTKGQFYIVNVAGTTNLDGIASWLANDWAIFTGTTWEKVSGNDAAVISVANRTGSILLTVADVAGALAAANNLSELTDKPLARSTIGAPGEYTTTVGDGATTTFTISQATHGLAANQTNDVSVKRVSTGGIVVPGISVAANGDVTLTFSPAPTTAQYRVTIRGKT